MSLNVEYVGFAEGATMDLRGNIALLGFATPFVAVAGFPGLVSPFFVVVAEEEPVHTESERFTSSAALVSMDVDDPDGHTIFHTEQVQPSQKTLHPNLPARFQLIAQIPLSVPKPGIYKYKLRVTLVSTDTPILAVEKSLRVFPADEVSELPAH